MYLTTEQVKNHLNIETEDTQYDVYLTDLIIVSETLVEKHINCLLIDLIDENGNIPMPLLHSMLLLIGHYFTNRELVSLNGKATELPFSYKYILDLYIKY